MIRIGIAAFSKKGGRLGSLLAREFTKEGCVCEGFLSARHQEEGMKPFSELDTLSRMLFEKEDIIIFVGACGIAVRAVAPYLKNKMEDPGVLVVDECGKYVISLLSGHVGRANDFTYQAARLLNAEPVITTATDRNGMFAVDDWAVKNHLRIVDPASVREISSRILSGERVGFYSQPPVFGKLPVELTYAPEMEAGIEIFLGDGADGYDGRTGRFPVTCRLVPMDLTVGIGCKKGKSSVELRAFVSEIFDRYHLQTERIDKICSISVKAEEKGLLELARALRVPFETFAARQLMQAEGDFTASEFVAGQVGADNVCERSAYIGSHGGRMLVKKQASGGMTIAVCQREHRIRFPEAGDRG